MMFVGQYPNELEHVCIVESISEDGMITSFDFGQFHEGKKCSLKCTRQLRKGRVYDARGNSRAYIGSIDPTKLPLNRFAIDLKSIS